MMKHVVMVERNIAVVVNGVTFIRATESVSVGKRSYVIDGPVTIGMPEMVEKFEVWEGQKFRGYLSRHPGLDAHPEHRGWVAFSPDWFRGPQGAQDTRDEALRVLVGKEISQVG